MQLHIETIREIIREALLREVDIEDVGDMCYATGSTHVMKTCTIGKDKYFLKFTDESLVDGVDPSLQVLVEYLAYCVYALYPSIKIPAHVQLVYDRKKKRVGIATTPVAGKMGLPNVDAKSLARMMSAGVYVDCFLANYDAVGTGTGNVIVNDDEATRIDPGASMTYRATGGRKGAGFSTKPSELQTMFDPNSPGIAHASAGRVYQYADLKKAGEVFMSVSWGDINAALIKASEEVTNELMKHDMNSLTDEWTGEANHIITILKSRHHETVQHIQHVMK